MKKYLFVLVVISAACLVVFAQKNMKPWTEWTQKDATKMLNDSAWGQTQTETNTNEMFFSPTARGGSGSSGSASGGQGATNQATSVNYRIRFLSSRPIRQAFARSILLQQKTADSQNGEQMKALEAQLKTFAEQKSLDWVVIAVSFDSTDQRFSNSAMQVFNSSNSGVLQNNTYLEVKGGKRIFLKEYRAPINDGMGAKFIFPRVVDNQPIVVRDGGDIRFYSEVSKDIKLNMRFKLADMIYEGQFEY
jgi:hypothetical protein